MIAKSGRLWILALPLILIACGTSATPTSQPGNVTSTQPSPTTTADAPTTTTGNSTSDEAEGSGCTPGPGELDDGQWFGYVITSTATDLEFDLACWFTGDAAVRAAAEDGEESPPPNDYYIRNVNETTRTLEVAAAAEVVWFPQFGDPASEATTTYENWIVEIEARDFMPGVWLEVEDGVVTSIHEQWVP